MSDLLEVQGISKAYGPRRVLADVSLSLAKGSSLAILGPNGAGKTTLLRCIGCLASPDAGYARLDSIPYLKSGGFVGTSKDDIRSQIVSVLQSVSLFPAMTICDNLTFALKTVRKLNTDEAVSAARDMAQRLDCSGLLERYPNQISGGQAQKVAIARALLMRPKILLLDEITSALSPESIREVISALRAIRSSEDTRGMGIILVTHQLSFAEEFADDTAFMSDGRILERLSSAGFAKECSSQEARKFIDSAS